MYKHPLKRLCDLVFSSAGLIFLLPVFLIIILLLAVTNRGKVFFIQERPGKEGKMFRIIKFKSMNDNRDKDGKLLPDRERITPIGRFIRKTSLDEIPQLINVLKGDMSLVGPRPLLPSDLDFDTEKEKLRHTVSPGITGLAQISDRNTLNPEKRFEMDVRYIENLSFKNDVKILCRTMILILKGADTV